MRKHAGPPPAEPGLFSPTNTLLKAPLLLNAVGSKGLSGAFGGLTGWAMFANPQRHLQGFFEQGKALSNLAKASSDSHEGTAMDKVAGMRDALASVLGGVRNAITPLDQMAGRRRLSPLLAPALAGATAAATVPVMMGAGSLMDHFYNNLEARKRKNAWDEMMGAYGNELASAMESSGISQPDAVNLFNVLHHVSPAVAENPLLAASKMVNILSQQGSDNYEGEPQRLISQFAMDEYERAPRLAGPHRPPKRPSEYLGSASPRVSAGDANPFQYRDSAAIAASKGQRGQGGQDSPLMNDLYQLRRQRQDLEHGNQTRSSRRQLADINQQINDLQTRIQGGQG